MRAGALLMAFVLVFLGWCLTVADCKVVSMVGPGGRTVRCVIGYYSHGTSVLTRCS